jgi:ABC-2 type transport system permease protein
MMFPADRSQALDTDVGLAPSPRAPSRLRATALHLLWPRVAAARNRIRRFRRRDRIRVFLFGLLATGFGSGVFTFFYRALSYFLSVPEFGPVLTYKLLSMVFITFLSILLFSNIVTALSVFYLSRDLDRVVAAPVPPQRFFRARFAATVVDSSWMLLLFAAPAFVAYGVAHQTGPAFYLMTLLALPPFLVIAGAVGVIITTILVNVFPARRTRDILILLSVLAVAVLYLLFRLVQPERLVNPEGFSDFMAFLAAMQTPQWRFLPSTWATEILFPLLGLRDGRPLLHFLLLCTTAAVALMAVEAVLSRFFLRGWSRAQEGRQIRLTRQPLAQRALTLLTAPLGSHTQLLIVKEAKIFFRDTSQWSQLILLGALIVVYVYNFSVLPVRGSPLVTFYFKNLVAFLNLALAAFVSAAVAVRFVFPAFSVEGRAFWMLRTAPLSLRRLWWAKFWIAALPLLVLGEVLVVATNSYLDVMPFMMWLAAGTLGAMIFAIVALGLAVGTAYPNFEAENAAQIAAGSGGLVYMVLCMSFIGTVVVLEAWPVYVMFMYRFSGTPPRLGAWAGIIGSFAAVAALHIAVFWASVRYGLRRLETIEI